MLNITGCHLHQNANKTWSFVGRVPLDVYYDTDALTAEQRERLRAAAEHGMAWLVQKSLGVKTRVWPSHKEAIQWAAARGVEVA